MTRWIRRLVAGSVATVVLAMPVPIASAAVDVFAGACLVKLAVTDLPGDSGYLVETEPGGFCFTNDGTGVMTVTGTVGPFVRYLCSGGVLSGSVDVSVDAAFESFSATDVDFKLVSGNAAVSLALSLHTGAQHLVASGLLEEDNTPVEECFSSHPTITMHGVVVFETPTDVTV